VYRENKNTLVASTFSDHAVKSASYHKIVSILAITAVKVFRMKMRSSSFLTENEYQVHMSAAGSNNPIAKIMTK
jgi:hypothetical protein